jgi:hypothetical protein
MLDREAYRDDRILTLFERHGTLTLWGIAAVLHRSKNRRATREELAATRQALHRLVARGLLVTVGPSHRWTYRAPQEAASERSAGTASPTEASHQDSR